MRSNFLSNMHRQCDLECTHLKKPPNLGQFNSLVKLAQACLSWASSPTALSSPAHAIELSSSNICHVLTSS